MLGMDALSLFLLQAFVVIVAARLLGLVARKIHQPMVVAEITAGILLGPSLLGLVWPEGLAFLFPESSLPALSLFSQVGLILFMFLVGLEFDTDALKGRGRASVMISHSSIVAPFFLGGILAYYIHPILSPDGVSFVSAALFIGVAMSVTAFPVLARILVERKLLKTSVGSITIACAAVDDVTAWCILAFVVSTVRSTGWEGAAITTALALVYIVAMLLLVRPFFERLIQTREVKEGLSQNIVAVALILVLISSGITEAVGIHALFGAFVFGAIVPKQKNFAQNLAVKLEDLVVVFLLPLFFAFSGLRTEVGLLNTTQDWLICALVILVACVGKFGGSYLAARFTGLPWRESAALGILMNTRGLMELVVLNIGLDLGVISPKLFTMMVLMALFTTFITTPILELVYPQRELAKGLLDKQLEASPLKALPGLRTLVGVANRETGPRLLGLVRHFVTPDDAIFALHLKRADHRTSSYAKDEAEPSDLFERVGMSSAELGSLGLSVRPLSFVSANPGLDICNVADVKDVDFVLLGWHKPLISRGVLGGVVFDVLKDSGSHVGVFIDRDLGEPERILIPYAGSPHDELALAMGARFAVDSACAVTLLYVAGGEQEAAKAEASRESLLEGFEGKAELSVVVSRDPAEAALAESRKGYDLVIVGVGRRWGLPVRNFGLLPEEFVVQSSTSLLIVSKNEERALPSAKKAALKIEETG